MDWLQGSPEQRLSDLDAQQVEWAKKTSSPAYRALRARHDTPIYDPAIGITVDPRRERMNMVADELYPRRTSDALQAEGNAYDYAMLMGQRMRDTALRGVQEGTKGNYLKSLELVARSPVAAVYPPASAGTYGAPDDWREQARKDGVSEAAIMAFDYGTDPEMWVTAPVRGPLAFVVPALPMAAARSAARTGDDALRLIGNAADAARYGRGAPTHLVDEAGDVIRRLRNSPQSTQLRIEYAR
jgi:hypothetical protein